MSAAVNYNQILRTLDERCGEFFGQNNNSNSKSTTSSRRFFFCPGKAVIIGDHVDADGGSVLQIPVQEGIYAACCPDSSETVTVVSSLFPQPEIFELSQLIYEKKGSWRNYIVCALLYLKQKNICPLTGMQIYLHSSLPVQAGLNASTALVQIIIFSFLKMHAGVSLNTEQEYFDFAAHSYNAEKAYAPEATLFSDHLCAPAAQPGSIVLSNTLQRRCKNLPFINEKLCFLLVNTMQLRPRKSDVFRDRIHSNHKSLRKLQTFFPKIKTISELLPKDLLTADEILEPVEHKRIMHIVSECQRVIEIVKELRANDFFSIGINLYNSHTSIKNDYNMSTGLCDSLVDASKSIPGVIGARITGAGLGGCIIVLLDRNILSQYQSRITELLKKKENPAPSFYLAENAGGIREIQYT